MDKYEKVKKIGSGTFGMVHLIRRKADGAYFALKRVPLDQSVTEGSKAINNEVGQLLLWVKEMDLHTFSLYGRFKCCKVWRMQMLFDTTIASSRKITSAS